MGKVTRLGLDKVVELDIGKLIWAMLTVIMIELELGEFGKRRLKLGELGESGLRLGLLLDDVVLLAIEEVGDISLVRSKLPWLEREFRELEHGEIGGLKLGGVVKLDITDMGIDVRLVRREFIHRTCRAMGELRLELDEVVKLAIDEMGDTSLARFKL